MCNDDFNETSPIDPIEPIDPESIESQETGGIFTDFSDVLDVSLLNDGHGFQVGANSATYSIAKYDQINVVEIGRRATAEAKNFVQKVTTFIAEAEDSELSKAHIEYIKQVGKFEIQNLSDLLRIAQINSIMINNIVERINSTVAEDYAMISSYNNLIVLHMKLIREIKNLYVAIPNTMRKMKAEMLTNQDVEVTNKVEQFSEELGETHFNNQKQLLATLAAKIKDNK
jgi:sulfur relay (sulfurtransferase) DsrC/TusE family protein